MNILRQLACLWLLLCSAPALADTWHRADTHHFTIYSNGSAGQLEDFAIEAEKFDALLRFVFNRPTQDDPAKLTIYLLRNSRHVEALAGRNIAGFYSANLEQSYAVSNREFSVRDNDLSGKTVLFHEYAHHFMFNNFSYPMPAWFVEGFAEYVATAEFDKDGSWNFGKPPQFRAFSIQQGPVIDIEDLLQTQPGELSPAARSAFYGWAWALTHMLYADPDERGDQIGRYLAEINQGADSLTAARNQFGDLDALEKSLRRYVRRSMGYSGSAKPLDYKQGVEITRLSRDQSDLRELILKRLSTRDYDDLRPDLLKVASRSDLAEAWYQLAQLEYDAAHVHAGPDTMPDFSASEAALERALAAAPDHVRANVLAGRLLLEPFDHDRENADPAAWEKAREYFMKANRTDPKDALPLYFYAETFRMEGKDHEMVGPALESAFFFRPEARQIRSSLAFYLAKQGEYDIAIRLLSTLANDPHSRGDWAKRAIARMEAARDGEAGTVIDDEPDSESAEAEIAGT